jgi:ribosomal protein S3
MDEAFTTYGVIGVKVTIFKGEIWPDKIEEEFYAKPKKG